MTPLRILMAADVDPVHVIGGAERMLNEHCRRLATRGHRVVVLTRREDRKLPEEEVYDGVHVVYQPVGGTPEILRGFDPDHLFASAEATDIARLLEERLPGIVGNEALRVRCREHVLSTYSWDVLIPQVEALMAEVARSRPVPGAQATA